MTTDPKPKKKKRRRGLWVLIGLVVLVGLCYIPVGPVEIEIGYDTTRLEGPLNDDGTVNYVAACAAAWAEGVTRDNNAAYLLLDALGPKMIPEDVRAEVLRRMEYSFPTGGKHFITHDDWLASHPEAKEAMRQADVRIFQDEGMELLFKGQDCPSAAAWVRDNAAALEILVAASNRSRLYVPPIPRTDPPRMSKTWYCQGHGCLGPVQALVVRAMLKLRDGHSREALADIRAAHRLARLVGQSPLPMARLRARMADRLAIKAGTAVAVRGDLTAEEAAELVTALNQLGSADDCASAVDRLARYFFLDMVTAMSRGDLSAQPKLDVGPEDRKANVVTSLDMDWNEMLRVGNYWYDRQVDAVGRATRAERVAALEELDRKVDQMREAPGQWYFEPEMDILRCGGWPCRRRYSRLCAELLMSEYLWPSNLISDVTLSEDLSMRMDLTKVAFALAGFHAVAKRWPARLEALAPKYLAEIPKDRFSGKALTYRLQGEGWIVYSVGRNGMDDGGVGGEEGWEDDKDDIAAEKK